ncbi:MAG TPA: hypothetical protein VEZ12_12925, partial [Herpetosiphonaceae bacterium]|nr:hypothetical protein [Herpetosiphonaceae bacterium]
MLVVACGGGNGGTTTEPGAATQAPAAEGGDNAAPTTAATEAPADEGATEATAMTEEATAMTEEATTMTEEATAEGTASTGATAEATTGAGGTAAGGAAMELPADCTNVELQYWNPFTGPDQPFMQTLVDNFNSANPNVQVLMTAQSEYGTQLDTAAASDTLPDVAIVNEDVVATQAFRNVIRPMDDVVAQMGLSADDFPEVAWNAGNVAGKQYAIPLSFVAMTMYYNEDLLKAAGLSAPPTDREEFEQAAAAMTKDGNNGFL